jgi:hypothetical protein
VILTAVKSTASQLTTNFSIILLYILHWEKGRFSLCHVAGWLAGWLASLIEWRGNYYCASSYVNDW